MTDADLDEILAEVEAYKRLPADTVARLKAGIARLQKTVEQARGLLADVHLTESNGQPWLYAGGDQTDAEWIARRDAFLSQQEKQ